MKLNTKKRRKLVILLSLFIVCIIFFYAQNNFIQITEIDIRSQDILNEIKIVHLSDLHGKEFGKNNSLLISKVKEQTPDIAVFTGDLIDRSGKNIQGSVAFLSELNKFCPVYYIPGNHEHWSGLSEAVFEQLKTSNIKVLRCDSESISIKNTRIDILGMDEFSFDSNSISEKIQVLEKSEGFKLILSHYPENFSSLYNSRDIDLVLSGHAHGGQFIIPFAGGLYAPGQGFFPRYYKGRYTENGVNLVVSRGLGNSAIPIRVFNRPEIVSISLNPST